MKTCEEKKERCENEHEEDFLICAVMVSFLGLAHGNAYGVDPCLPDDFPEFIINQYGETAPGYVIGSVNSKNPAVGSYFIIMDNAGVPVFYNGWSGGINMQWLIHEKKGYPGNEQEGYPPSL